MCSGGVHHDDSDVVFRPQTPQRSSARPRDIVVVARDTASGTRTAFHELINGVKANDTETDNLVVGALEFDSTTKWSLRSRKTCTP